MKLLEEKGLISRQQGVGTRVAMRIGYSLDKDSGFTAQALRHGSSVSNRWLLRTWSARRPRPRRRWGWLRG